MKPNAAGLVVSGALNPNWKGGPLDKICEVCKKPYIARRAQSGSRFCSLQCVGISQRGKGIPRRLESKACEVCGTAFIVHRSHVDRKRFCSVECSGKWRSSFAGGEANPNWCGGLSNFPYPWNFQEISKRVIEYYGGVCQNPECNNASARLTTHHINYIKEDCSDSNLIALCTSCNSRANYGRDRWQAFYSAIKEAGTIRPIIV